VRASIPNEDFYVRPVEPLSSDYHDFFYETMNKRLQSQTFSFDVKNAHGNINAILENNVVMHNGSTAADSEIPVEVNFANKIITTSDAPLFDDDTEPKDGLRVNLVLTPDNVAAAKVTPGEYTDTIHLMNRTVNIRSLYI
jgi:hypothetical protein